MADLTATVESEVFSFREDGRHFGCMAGLAAHLDSDGVSLIPLKLYHAMHRVSDEITSEMLILFF